MTIRLVPALVAAGLLLTGCSHPSSVQQPVARTHSASAVSTATASASPSFATSTPRSSADQAFTSSVADLLPAYSEDNQVKIGKIVCQALEVEDSYDDAQTATSGLKLGKAGTAKLIHASIVSYCPASRSVEDEATAVVASPAPVDSTPAFDHVVSDKVTYKITSNSSTALITYTDNGSIEQATGATLPWTKTVVRGDFVSVSAQDDNGTTITCAILDSDGSVISKHTSTGAYAIASCDNAG